MDVLLEAGLRHKLLQHRSCCGCMPFRLQVLTQQTPDFFAEASILQNHETEFTACKFNHLGPSTHWGES